MNDTIVINEGTTFMVTDNVGNVPRGTPLGLFRSDTRYLNKYILKVNDRDLVPLSFTRRGYIANISLTNPELKGTDGNVVPEGTLHILRTMFISTNFYEKLFVKNTNSFPVKLSLELSYDTDFRDIFEVKGINPMRRGLRALIEGDEGKNIILRYEGLDNVIRRTEFYFKPAPEIYWDTAIFNVDVEPYETREIDIEVVMTLGGVPVMRQEYGVAKKEIEESYGQWQKQLTQISTDSDVMNSVIETCILDLRSLIINTKKGLLVPAAGIPWYDTIFGRDSIITSLQTLMLNPTLAQSTLQFLTIYQGNKVDTWTDEQPGKILHEIREGELANLHHIPHTPYYGTIDATLLYLILLSESNRWMGDQTLVSDLRGGAEQAALWIDNYGDLDKDGYVEYIRMSEKLGLVNQGWKDSHDSIVFSDGRLADAPIALSEVQGYTYDARLRFAELYPDSDLARLMKSKASELKAKFNDQFWMADKGFFAEAMDKDKRLVDSITTNPGHCLWSGLIEGNKAEAMAKRFMQEDMYSGWGLRTLASSEKAYDPQSYHDGSIWPHDNSLVAWGLKNYGFADEANMIITSLIEASKHFDYRLPELFCGYKREEGKAPIIYHSTCSPQAWASGSIILFIQTMLGLYPDAPNGVLYVKPTLPHWLKYVTVKNLRMGKESLNLEFRRVNDRTTFDVIGSSGKIKVEGL
ncbi:amylo-alpha-1,6-glucosidase [Methanocella arvoryzae]|uniref:Predicted glycoside transferase n=1 Tax=Methanocella arvoryzae (strain DSM 22066 / NBRC 105507 / MRE50) TaxID=351160 RepID=Q0W318_METAR|nr:glycogen debranching N-terminal domain-containing protein [Methanocella arvoryzae]CAJ37225.1 predicted glycoside transferase [Methanocella arvoryzae MRE50]